MRQKHTEEGHQAETYRVFEPGDPRHPHHDAGDDGPEAEEGELSGSVALVPGAVGGVLLPGRHGAGGGQAVLPDNSEQDVNNILNITITSYPFN